MMSTWKYKHAVKYIASSIVALIGNVNHNRCEQTSHDTLMSISTQRAPPPTLNVPACIFHDPPPHRWTQLLFNSKILITPFLVLMITH